MTQLNHADSIELLHNIQTAVSQIYPCSAKDVCQYLGLDSDQFRNVLVRLNRLQQCGAINKIGRINRVYMWAPIDDNGKPYAGKGSKHCEIDNGNNMEVLA